MAITLVLPCIPPPTIKTIPNSPIVWANDIMNDVRKPLLDKGMITFLKVSSEFAPRVLAVLIVSLPILSNDDWRGWTQKGNEYITDAKTKP